MKKDTNHTHLMIYNFEGGKTRVEVKLENSTVWLSQSQLAEVFQTTPQNITMHIKAIYNEEELEEDSTCKYYLQVQLEGSRRVERQVKHYNLEMVIAIGYRVRTHRGTHFRKWATERLNEYLVKGFTMDDKRLKAIKNLDEDYFDELLERIKDIRSSEKRMYLKVRDIYALSVDYDSKTFESKEFFATVQNKLHYAISGNTASEVIKLRADSNEPNMGLTNWEGERVRKSDIGIAKNYLTENELNSLNRIVTMYLDYAEDQALRKKVMYMKDWREKLDGFLKFNEKEILENAGKISAEEARKHAEVEYEKYRLKRIQEDDLSLDELEKTLTKKKK